MAFERLPRERKEYHVTSYCIVALPREDDPVWGISSEKKPHMTLLFLGENLDQSIVEPFVGQAASLLLTPFSLKVNGRGVLGDDEADVLFFAREMIPYLENFRQYLLTNPEVSKAYDSTKQYPTWIPHLTLGYPDSPARDDTRKYPGIYNVDFDRIALWYGDSMGYEFQLEDPIMNDIENPIAHYGIKGMKWGVRRSQAQLDGDSDDAAAARVTIEKIKKNRGRVDSLTNKELEQMLNRMNLEQRYSRMIAEQKSAKSKAAQAKIKKFQETTKTVQDVINFLNTPIGKTIIKAIKSKFT